MPTSTRAARTTLYVVLFFVILAGVSSAYAQWEGGKKDDAAKAAQTRSDELSRCLSGYQIRYVSAPAERSREAEKRVLRLVAVGKAEGPEYLHAVEDFVSFETNVDEFERLNRRARLHPDAFLLTCRRDNP